MYYYRLSFFFWFCFSWVSRSLRTDCSGFRSPVWRPAANYWVTAARSVPLSANQGVTMPSFFFLWRLKWGGRNSSQLRLRVSFWLCPWHTAAPDPNWLSARTSALFGPCWDFSAALILSGWGEVVSILQPSDHQKFTTRLGYLHQGWAWLNKSVAGFLCWTSQFLYFIGDSKWWKKYISVSLFPKISLITEV